MPKKIVNVSITTIPPRYYNNTLKKFISSILKQTYEVNKIFITIPTKYQRFQNFTDEEIEDIKSYSNKIVILRNDFDSPLLKHIGYIDFVNDNEYMFIGDDDQEYHPELIEKMVDGIYNVNAVYQNRYHIVKHGTAGIIHGFVGLIYRKGLINPIKNFKIPDVVWTDDQLMSIYFHKLHIPINPSPINDFDEIYSYLNIYKHEKLGTGGDLCLSPETNKRDEEIKKLEIKYDVYFHLKNNKMSKGKIYDYDYDNLINLYIISFRELDENKILSINNFLEKHNHLNLKINLINKYPDDLEIQLNYLPEYHIKYHQDKLGMDLVKKNNGIYISINNNFDNLNILDFILSTENYFKNFENIIFTSFMN